MIIPWIMYLQVKETNKKNIRLYIPLVLVWLLLLPLLLLAAPFMLVAAVVTWKQGYGRLLLGTFPLMWAVAMGLSGLHIQVENPKTQTLISFH